MYCWHARLVWSVMWVPVRAGKSVMWVPVQAGKSVMWVPVQAGKSVMWVPVQAGKSVMWVPVQAGKSLMWVPVQAGKSVMWVPVQAGKRGEAEGFHGPPAGHEATPGETTQRQRQRGEISQSTSQSISQSTKQWSTVIIIYMHFSYAESLYDTWEAQSAIYSSFSPLPLIHTCTHVYTHTHLTALPFPISHSLHSLPPPPPHPPNNHRSNQTISQWTKGIFRACRTDSAQYWPMLVLCGTVCWCGIIQQKQLPEWSFCNLAELELPGWQLSKTSLPAN